MERNGFVNGTEMKHALICITISCAVQLVFPVVEGLYCLCSENKPLFSHMLKSRFSHDAAHFSLVLLSLMRVLPTVRV